MAKFIYLFAVTLSLVYTAFAVSRTSPPSGSLIVRVGTTTAGEFATLTAAVDSLPSDSSARSIFIYPGTYAEQIDITRSGPVTVSTA